jgi:hypothetical protein
VISQMFKDAIESIEDDWSKGAIWLDSAGVNPWTPMKYGEDGCAQYASTIFFNREIELVEKPSIADVCGTDLDVLHHADAMPKEFLYYGTVPKDEDDSAADQGCLIPMKTADGDSPPLTAMSTICENHSRLICIMFHSILYPEGHCVVVHDDLLCDPLMPKWLRFPSPHHKLLFLCSVNVIIGRCRCEEI